jgi:hypothetical protein
MHYLGDVKGSKKKRSEWNVAPWQKWVTDTNDGSDYGLLKDSTIGKPAAFFH